MSVPSASSPARVTRRRSNNNQSPVPSSSSSPTTAAAASNKQVGRKRPREIPPPPLTLTSLAAASRARSARVPLSVQHRAISRRPLDAFLADQKRQFDLYGYALFRASRQSRELAVRVVQKENITPAYVELTQQPVESQVPLDCDGDIPVPQHAAQMTNPSSAASSPSSSSTAVPPQHEYIRGSVLQSRLNTSDPTDRAIITEFHSILYRHFETLGMERSFYGSNKHGTGKFDAVKTLVCEPGAGHQPLHWDGLQDDLTCLMYCTAGNSTRVPRFAAQTFPHDYSLSREALEYRLQLLNEDYFHSVPVMPGDILVMRHRVPHGGSRCEPDATEPRVVLFDAFSWKPKTLHIDCQYYKVGLLRDYKKQTQQERERARASKKKFNTRQRQLQQEKKKQQHLAAAASKPLASQQIPELAPSSPPPQSLSPRHSSRSSSESSTSSKQPRSLFSFFAAHLNRPRITAPPKEEHDHPLLKKLRMAQCIVIE